MSSAPQLPPASAEPTARVERPNRWVLPIAALIGLGGLGTGISIAVLAGREDQRSEATADAASGIDLRETLDLAGATEDEADQILLDVAVETVLTEEREATVCDSLDRYGEEITRRVFVESYEVVAGPQDPPSAAVWGEIRSRVDC
jgi:hypothetical protein